MNGVDWPAVRKQYERLLPLVASRSDLNWLIGQVIGELAGSHLRCGGGDDGTDGHAERSVLLGADYALDPSSGRYRFGRIYQGDNTRAEYRSPLSWPGINVPQGDYLLAVNGHELIAPETPDSALAATAGTVTLTLASTAGGQRREVRVQPVSNETSLRELDHFEQERILVSKLSGGRIAYIGMSDMIGHGMQQFVRQFYPQLSAEAVVIDDRGNPGGNIDEMILERLRRSISSMQTGRDRVPQTQPDQVLNGPKAMLIDGFSSSDGEVFPLHFREYGLGPLIGSRTWGGVRGLRTNWPLLDGGSVVVSEITFYDKQGKWLVENYGVDPDVSVERTPAAALAGRDPALESAVQILMRKLGTKPRRLAKPPSSGSDYPSAGNVPPAFLPTSQSDRIP